MGTVLDFWGSLWVHFGRSGGVMCAILGALGAQWATLGLLGGSLGRLRGPNASVYNYFPCIFGSFWLRVSGKNRSNIISFSIDVLIDFLLSLIDFGGHFGHVLVFFILFATSRKLEKSHGAQARAPKFLRYALTPPAQRRTESTAARKSITLSAYKACCPVKLVKPNWCSE